MWDLFIVTVFIFRYKYTDEVMILYRFILNCVVLLVWEHRWVTAQSARDAWNRLRHPFEPEERNSISFHDGTRPFPSNQLPIIDLEENPNPLYDPKEEDLEYKRLRRLLGRDFDRDYMSTVRPLEHVLHRNGTLDFKIKKGRPKGRRPLFIKYFGQRVYTGETQKPIRLKLKREDRKKVQKYLWSYTHCPVFHTWKDLGVRFWPRWIREGQCFRGKSCSIPPGMYCQPSDSMRITLLRWYCRGPEVGTNCSWIKVQYPVLTECACSCS